VCIGLAPLGCQPNDEIRHYRVPKPETYPEPEPKVRMLAAIFPHPEHTWFFKFMAPAADVKAHQAEFNQFIRSVRINDQKEKPLSWALPEGWVHEEGKSPLRYATLRFGTRDHPLEVTVTGLGAEAGSPLDNINRWRGQIGLKPIAKADMNKTAKSEEINGLNVILVDMGGPGAAPKGMGR
jgi:hypothetical protein